jgi:hypothetical protein
MRIGLAFEDIQASLGSSFPEGVAADSKSIEG